MERISITEYNDSVLIEAIGTGLKSDVEKQTYKKLVREGVDFSSENIFLQLFSVGESIYKSQMTFEYDEPSDTTTVGLNKCGEEEVIVLPGLFFDDTEDLLAFNEQEFYDHLED